MAKTWKDSGQVKSKRPTSRHERNKMRTIMSNKKKEKRYEEERYS